jgi:RHS repeat-associated protein
LLADGTNNYAYDAESYIKTLNGTGAAYTYDADGQRVYKQVASDTTEYVYLSGQPIAERKANGDWSDYIFVGPRRLARADTYEDRIHIFGTECSSCGSQYEQFTLGNIGNLAGHVVQQGDKLYLFQWQATGTRAGMNLHFSDGTETNGLVNDQDGSLIDADNFYQTWHYRRVDLSQFAGKTIADVRLIVEGYTQPGRWDAYYHDISVVAADGTVYPLYARQTSISLSASGSSGMTGVGYEINHNVGAGAYPIVTTNYYHGDHLGSTRLISSFNGYPVWSSTFLPFGQEWNQQSTVNHYKFTGKERDSESGLDNFGARYFGSNMGRFMSPDWSRAPEGVPYADFDNPQSLNLYAYVMNNPLSHRDADGHGCDPDTSFIDKDGAMHVVAGACHDDSWLQMSVAYGHHFVDQALVRAKGAWHSLSGRFFRGWRTGPLQNPGLHQGFSTAHRLNSAQVRDIIEKVETETGRAMSQWTQQDVEKAVEEVRSAGGDVKAFTESIAENNPGARTLSDEIKPIMDAAKSALQAVEDFAAKVGPAVEEGVEEIEEECAGGGCIPPL